MAAIATGSVYPLLSSVRKESSTPTPSNFLPSLPLRYGNFTSSLSFQLPTPNLQIVSCYPQPSSQRTRFNPATKLFVSGLSFRTTEDSLTSAFKNFGELIEVNLVMDKIANRSRGFAFLRYATEAESQKAIEGMHGKFLDGRVIFVEVAKPRSELGRGPNNNNKQ